MGNSAQRGKEETLPSERLNLEKNKTSFLT